MGEGGEEGWNEALDSCTDQPKWKGAPFSGEPRNDAFRQTATICFVCKHIFYVLPRVLVVLFVGNVLLPCLQSIQCVSWHFVNGLSKL